MNTSVVMSPAISDDDSKPPLKKCQTAIIRNVPVAMAFVHTYAGTSQPQRTPLLGES